MSNVISNVSIANLTSTWTEDTRVYTGLGLSVTATNYDPASKVFKLMVNGNTIFSVDAAGTLTAPAISVANAIVDISAPFNKANAAYLVANSAANNTNAVYDVVNVVYTVTNSSYTVTNASFGVANASFGFANGLTTIITASFSKANVAYDLAVASFNSSNNVHNSANAAGVIANAAFNKANNVVISVDFSPVFNTANAAFDKANSGYTLAASAYDLAFYAGTATNTTAAFAKANAANSLAHETGIAANNYAGAMANAANGFASSIVASNLITARAYTNSATISANNYAGFMANSGNLYTESIVASNLTTARAYTNSATVAANNYAGAMANAVDVSLTSSITTLRQYVNTSTVAANAYSGFMSNAVNLYTVATYSTITFTEAAFDKANDAYSLVQILGGDSSANIANLQNNLSLINAVYDVANAAFNKANSANVFAFNTDIKTIAAFEKANTLEISANAYAGVMANSSNGYAGVMANSANGYAESIVASNLTTARAYTNSATISANNRAGVMVNSANGYAESIVASNLVTSRAYTNSATISANVYAGVMSNSSNGYAESIVAANLVISREYTNTSTAAANNRAGFMANSANAIAASIVAANLITARAYTNSATVAANNYAGFMANSGNGYAETIVAANLVVSREYTNTSVIAANNYAGVMANSANGFAATIVAANLVVSRAYTNSATIAANVYSGVMANSANGFAATIVDANLIVSRAYTNSATIAANSYAGVMANSANGIASTIVAANLIIAREYTNTSVIAANNYAGQMANSANGIAATIVAANLVVAREYTNSATLAANNYASAVGLAANAYAQSISFNSGPAVAASFDVANAAYGNANTKLANTSGVFFEGDLYFPKGNIGVGLTTTTYRLDVAGDFRTTGNAFITSHLTVNGVNVVPSFISSNNYAGFMSNAANGYAGAMANSANGYAGFMANAANAIASTIVAANLITARAYTNSATIAANVYSGVMANSANGYAESIVASNLVTSRAYTNTSTIAANTYSGFMANSANGYTETIVASNLVTSRAYTNSATIAANVYAGVMANSANGIAASIVAANLITARAYTNTSVIAANNYAGVMANSANGYAESIVASNLVTSRAYTNTSVIAANNYAGVMANSANGRADTKVATVTGTLGRITSTGGTTPVIDLASGVIADTNPRTGGISSITVDTYGRVTSVTGSAGYTTGSGYLPLSGGTMTGTLTLVGQVWGGNITWNNNINIGISGESSFDVGTGGQWGVWDTGSSNFWMRTNYNDHLRLVENGKNVYVYGGRLYTDTSQTYIHSGSIGSYATTGVAAGTGLTGGGTTGSLTLALSTVGAGQATYSSGISAIIVDAYGRVTGVTGSANYLPLSGGTLTGRVIQSDSGFGVAYDDTINNRVDSGFWETAYATTANGWPETTSTWYHLLASTHSNLSNYFSMQFAGSFFDSNALYYRATNGSGTTAWNKIWHAGNDGAASGLDADLLDGQQGSYYLNAGNMSAGTLAVIRGGTGVSTSTGSGSVVLSNSPTLVTPILGTPTSGNLSNCTFPTLNQNTTGSAGSVTATVTGTTGTNLVSGFMADNDSCRIRIGADATDAGWLEIATADNGTEPIYFRQYTGAFATVTRTLTLLDGSGNTTIPGNLTLSPANPTITSGSSYITIPNGLYVSGGTPYFQNQIQARGGIYNDTGVTLTLAGGTGGYTTVTGSCRSPIFYKSDDVAVRWTGNDFVLRGISPTIYLRDNDGSSNSAMIHVNGNTFYVLRGTGDTETWSQVNGQWPLVINLNTNGMTAGGTLNTVGNITAPNVYASRYYDNDDAAYYIDPAATSIVNQVNYALLSGQNVNTRDKVRVWGSSSYTIGMTSPFTFGAIANDYAMTFQMNNASTRGFWWGDEVHTSAQGAMSLSTDGKLTVAHSIRAGYGEGDTTVPGATYRLDISGIGHASTDFRAPSFVDSITTAYYLDPAGASNLNSATFAGTVSVPSGFTVRKQDNANEGGEFYVEKATNSTLAGNIIIDNITNSLRIFEGASPFRGVTLDISACGSQSTLIPSGNINSFVSRIRMQSMTISVINTFPALTSTYSGQMFMLIVNGTCFTPADSPSPFSVSGTTITWNGASVWSVNPGDVVTAIYSY